MTARPYCPWSHLGQLEGVTLQWHDQGEAGLTTFSSRTVSLRMGMSAAERRTTLAHELVHLERGPVTAAVTHAEEGLVEVIAGLRLVPDLVLRDLPELVREHGPEAAKAFLGIDGHMLRTLDWFVDDTRIVD